MPEPFIGLIVMFGCNFAPQGWAFCNGNLQSIAENSALFSLIGTTYGGDGQETFALPDVRGRVPIGQGQGPGLSNRTIGEVSGTESVTLLSSQMPAHNHLFNVNNTGANVHAPVANSTIGAATDINGDASMAYGTSAPNVTMAPGSISVAGGGQPHNNLMPFLTINYCIALFGIFPSRN